VKLRLVLLVMLTGALFTGGAFAARTVAHGSAPTAVACSAGYVSAHLSDGDKCLRNGEICSASMENEYHAYGFTCTSGRLASYSGGSSPTTTTTTTTTAATTTTTPTTTTAPSTTTSTPTTTVAPTTTAATTTTTATHPASSGGGSGSSRGTSAPNGTVSLGKTVLLHARSKSSGCKLGANPDPSCSPGAYYSGLTKAVICSASFRTGTIRNVPESEKHQVEVEYGLAAKGYGSTLEIDHLVSLELGGSNDIANLFPEEATFSNGNPGFHVKDKLENKLHDLVCSGAMTLSAIQHGIASDWQALYKQVFGKAPTG